MKLSYPILVLALAAVACKKTQRLPEYFYESKIDSTFTTGTPEGSTERGENADDLVENQQFDKKVSITFGGTTQIENPYEGTGVAITYDNNFLTITSVLPGVEYVLKGSGVTSNGVKILSNDNYKVTLNGVNMVNSYGPALNLQSTAKAFIVLAPGTQNLLTDGLTYQTTDNTEKGALYSKGDMIISGNGGQLEVTSYHLYGICSEKMLRIREGNIKVKADAEDALHATSGLIVDGGDVNLVGASHGIVVDNGYFISNGGSITMSVQQFGIETAYRGSDESFNSFVNINGGKILIGSTNGVCIESGGTLTVNGGSLVSEALRISTDNGVNSQRDIYINGGYVYSAGKSGLSTEGNITITGGVVECVGKYLLGAGIDCEHGILKITGGCVVGVGSFARMPDKNTSTVNSIILGGGGATQLLHVAQQKGNNGVLTFAPYVGYQTLLFACSRVKANTSYDIFTTGAVVGPLVPGERERSAALFYNPDYKKVGLCKGLMYVNAEADTTYTTGADRVTQFGGTVR